MPGRLTHLQKAARMAARKARRQKERKTKINQKIFELAGVKPTTEDFQAARNYLREQLPNSSEGNDSPKKLLSELYSKEVPYELIRVSQENYLKTIELVRESVTMILGAPDRDELIDFVCMKSKVERRENTDLIALIARSLINYGIKDGKPDPVARRLWSRDAAAIRFLNMKKVPIGGIVKYQEDHHGGVDWWSRQWSEFKKTGKEPGDEGPKPSKTSSKEANAESLPLEMNVTLLSLLHVGESAILLVTKQSETELEAGPFVKIGIKLMSPPSQSPRWKKIMELAKKGKEIAKPSKKSRPGKGH